MGRLENIIERNRNPGKSRVRKGLGIGFAMLVVFVVLILLIFTDLANPPEADNPAPPPPAAKPEGVRGVKLWSPKHSSGSAASGSATQH